MAARKEPQEMEDRHHAVATARASHTAGASRATTPPARVPAGRVAAAVAHATQAVAAAPAAAHGAAVPAAVLADAAARPLATFDVVVQGRPAPDRTAAARAVHGARAARPGRAAGLRRSFSVIDAATAEVTGDQLRALAADPRVKAVTPDAPIRPVGTLSNTQVWPTVTQASSFWSSSLRPPTIAIVDSGIDADRSDFGGRSVTQIDLVSGGRNSAGDGYGHGTAVASLAAGRATGFTGVAPASRLVSLDVFDDAGAGTIGDAIAAADWIHRNRAAYGIRVANFSLTGSVESSFLSDPLAHAVRRLWLSGVVVVAAAGNSGPGGVRYAPANDPFVITVGAVDTAGTVSGDDDAATSWSAHGYTPDGFRKPELSAPGQRLNAAASTSSTLYRQHPDRVVAPGYLALSGTSFSAPVVAGAAAQVLAVRPSWTPDQVKGALMLTAKPAADAASFASGVGVLRAADAAAVENPPNPNLALLPFLTPAANGDGVPVFDAASWSSAAQSDASWSSASWSSASWSSASWSSASWSSASWSSASWSSASWSSASWSSASWSSASSPAASSSTAEASVTP